MASDADSTMLRRAGQTRKDVSQLVAMPIFTPRPKPSLPTPSSSTSPAESSTSSSSHVNQPPSAVKGGILIAKTSPELQAAKIALSRIINKERDQVRWEYNVYATSFVPSALKSINAEQARISTTRWKHAIALPVYAHTFAGTSFISERLSNAPKTECDDNLSPDIPLTSSNYLHYFDILIKIERVAKLWELETQALYQVPLYRTQTPEGDLWVLSVPGLREDSPFIEMGDTLQIRQICVDGAGNVIQMPFYEDSPTGHAGYSPIAYRNWTGIQHDSSVYSVNRARETVYMKADGLDFLRMGHGFYPMAVNVVIPLRESLIQNQRSALVSVHSTLTRATRTPHEKTATEPTGHIDFLESPGAKHASKVTSVNNDRIQNNDWARRILFPTEADGHLQTQLRKIPHRALFDHAINYEQAHAVGDVCANNYGTLSYLISGPPGTGKTKTLVEMAMQLLNTTNIAHLLICAPSEAAADTLALRLKQYLNTKQLLRLNRPGRADNEVPRELMQYCYIENDMFDLPPFRQFIAFNIVVTSCRDAGILTDAHLTNSDLWNIERNMFSAFHPDDEIPTPVLHWGALLIDEAAQATEIDVLPAIDVVLPPTDYPTTLPQPRFVMAGDDNQLGPRTASRDTRLSTSLFARLFDRPLYKNHPLSRSTIKPSSSPPVLKKSMLPIIFPPFTNLIRNYRSHPSILSIPSSLFYNDTLIPEAPTPRTPLQHSPYWRGRAWPVLFLPHTGLDEIEREGGGWYNATEATLACSIAQTLVYESQVQQKDVCIMSPFAAQVKLLRGLIRSNAYGKGAGLWDVNIGPLEAFQGLENRVVVICTTRTRERFLDMDEQRGQGIVGQRRKMNVALTRAKEALFVIGNPAVLGKDEHWRQWMAFCWRNGLVADDEGVWKADDVGGGGERVGLLERALVAKGEQTGSKKALGESAAGVDVTGDYDAWVQSLREVMEEEEEEGEEEYENDYEGDEEESASKEE